MAGIFNVPVGAQVLAELIRGNELVNKHGDIDKLKKLRDYLLDKDTNDEISLDQLASDGMLQIINDLTKNKVLEGKFKFPMGVRDLKNIINREFGQDPRMALYRAEAFSRLNPDIQKHLQQLTLTPEQYEFDKLQARKLDSLFGIKVTDEGLAIDQALKLKHVLENSDRVSELNIDPLLLQNALDSRDPDAKLTIREFLESASFTKDEIDNLNLATLTKIVNRKNGKTFTLDDRLTAEEYDQLLEAINDYFKMKNIDLPDVDRLKKHLNTKALNFELFTIENPELYQELIHAEKGIQSDSISGLQFQANLHKQITESGLQEGLSKFKEMLENYGNDDRLTQHMRDYLGIPNKEAAQQYLNLIHQYEKMQDQLAQVQGKGKLDELIDLTNQEATKRDGITLDEMKQLGLTDNEVINNLGAKSAKTIQETQDKGYFKSPEELSNLISLADRINSPNKADQIKALKELAVNSSKGIVEVAEQLGVSLNEFVPEPPANQPNKLARWFAGTRLGRGGAKLAEKFGLNKLIVNDPTVLKIVHLSKESGDPNFLKDLGIDTDKRRGILAKVSRGRFGGRRSAKLNVQEALKRAGRDLETRAIGKFLEDRIATM